MRARFDKPFNAWYHGRVGKGGTFPYVKAVPSFLRHIRNEYIRAYVEYQYMKRAYRDSANSWPYRGHRAYKGSCAVCYEKARGR